MAGKEDTVVHPTREEIMQAGGCPPDTEPPQIVEFSPQPTTREDFIKAGAIPPDPVPAEETKHLDAEAPKKYKTRSAKTEE